MQRARVINFWPFGRELFIARSRGCPCTPSSHCRKDSDHNLFSFATQPNVFYFKYISISSHIPFSNFPQIEGQFFFPNSLCHFSIEGKFPITSKEMYHSRYFSILCKTSLKLPTTRRHFQIVGSQGDEKYKRSQ